MYEINPSLLVYNDSTFSPFFGSYVFYLMLLRVHSVQLNSAENEISELRPMIPLLQKEASEAKNTCKFPFLSVCSLCNQTIPYLFAGAFLSLFLQTYCFMFLHLTTVSSLKNNQSGTVNNLLEEVRRGEEALARERKKAGAEVSLRLLCIQCCSSAF